MLKRFAMVAGCLVAMGSADAASRPSTVAEILEDRGDALIKLMASQGGGQGIIETADVFSGESCVKIIPMQLFERRLAGWNYRIVENPRVGEYRYIRFAWKAPGARGIMLQMHDDKDWNLRLTAGIDEQQWGTKFVAAAPPTKWTIVTRDLFAEFGERNITGLALTVFGQAPGYFDHIYLGRSIEELDGIDATNPDGTAVQLKPEELEQLWAGLAIEDASKSYRAFWKLVADPAQSVPFLRKRLLWPRSPEAAAQVKKWIVELEAAEFQVRENAYANLLAHLESALGQLKEAVQNAPPESQMRMERLLKIATAPRALGKMNRSQLASRILKTINNAESKALLEELAKASP
jgi:hypothetical protein